MRTCAICGFRDSVGIIEWDGRGVPACSKCTDGLPAATSRSARAGRVAPPSRCWTLGGEHATREAILAAVGSGGADTAEIRNALGAATRQQGAVVMSAVARLVKLGALRSVEKVPGKRRAGYVYYPTGLAPRADVSDETLALVDHLDEPHTASEIAALAGRRDGRLGAALKALVRNDLIEQCGTRNGLKLWRRRAA